MRSVSPLALLSESESRHCRVASRRIAVGIKAGTRYRPARRVLEGNVHPQIKNRLGEAKPEEFQGRRCQYDFVPTWLAGYSDSWHLSHKPGK
jgi:hypothetical protein